MKTASCWRTSNTGLDRQPVKAGAQAVPRFRRAINLKQFRRYYHADSAMFAERLARRRQKGKPDVCIRSSLCFTDESPVQSFRLPA